MVDNSSEAPAGSQHSPPPASPLVADLMDTLQTGNSASVAEFWKNVRRAGGALVESDNAGYYWLTFVWRHQGDERPGGAEHSVAVLSHLNRFDIQHSQMWRIPGTDIWYLSYSGLHGDFVMQYRFAVNEPPGPLDARAIEERAGLWEPDPLNHRVIVLPPFGSGPARRSSFVEGPHAPRRRWQEPRPDPPGRVEHHRITTTILGDARSVWVYTPAQYDNRRAGQRFGLLIAVDEGVFREAVDLSVVFDNLIAERRIPPMLAMGIDVRSRGLATWLDELGCNEKFPELIVAELLPAMRDVYPISLDPRDITIAGFSRGGAASLHALWRKPEEIGNAIAMSPAVWLDNERLTAERIADGPLPEYVRISLNAGAYEQGLHDDPGAPIVDCTGRLWDVLTEQRTWVDFVLNNGGHDVWAAMNTGMQGFVRIRQPDGRVRAPAERLWRRAPRVNPVGQLS